jgi:hypothetical protein
MNTRDQALEDAAQVADRFARSRKRIWLSLSRRQERDLANEKAHRERGNEAEQIAAAIRALMGGRHR